MLGKIRVLGFSFLFFVSLVFNSYANCIKGNCNNGEGTAKWENDVYVGEWKDGLKRGKGTYTWTDGGKYVGLWKDGRQHGKATMYYGNGNKFVGEYKNGKRYGQGTYTWKNGDKYVGEFENGINGHGTKTFFSPYTIGSDEYVGNWKDGKEHGYGTFKSTHNDYTGNWKDGKWYGLGTSIYKAPAPTFHTRKCEGIWQKNRESGNITCTWDNGEKYVGNWKDGEKHGQGTLSLKDGKQYTGIWENNKLNGSYQQGIDIKREEFLEMFDRYTK